MPLDECSDRRVSGYARVPFGAPATRWISTAALAPVGVTENLGQGGV